MLKLRILLYFLCFLFLLPFFGRSQQFICDGNFYLSLSETDQQSVFFRVTINAAGNVEFTSLPVGASGATINSIGYRITDNFIYGLDPLSFDFYRIDNSGAATYLTTIAGLNTSHLYVAGAITPDGSHMVILGKTLQPEKYDVEIVMLNLDDYSINTIPLITTSTGGTPEINCADIAFDPITGILYGNDREAQRLVTFDYNTGVVDDTTFPAGNVAYNIGAMFFDAFGTLFGYGAAEGDDFQAKFFRFNKNNGTSVLVTSGPEASGNDGCSCPYTVRLNKTVNPEITTPCTEVEYVFTIANSSGIEQTGINFQDLMPPELTITEIIRNPYTGNVVDPIGTNEITITDMTIPLGIDSIIVKVEVSEEAEGIYKNQARVDNLPLGLGTFTISDNPRTIFQQDSTLLTVLPVSQDPTNRVDSICGEGTLELIPSFEGMSYEWSDGSTDASLTVSTAGMYTVITDVGCFTIVDTFDVFQAPLLEVELGEDIELILGDSVLLEPYVSEFNVSYLWEETPDSSLNCTICPTPYARPFVDSEYTLTITDLFGCTASDQLRIDVLREEGIYVPNVFTPNQDGFNDLFFIQGKDGIKVNEFHIYNRWGNKVFESFDSVVNDSSHGWNGMFRGKLQNNGVFAWYAIVEYVDGSVSIIKGDVAIVR